MRVLVCGGRDYHHPARVWDTLDKYPVAHIVNGGATGVDDLATIYAKRYGIPFTVYPARWKEHGKAAGPIRNRMMLEQESPDLVIAFPGGNGTANMVTTAKEYGYRVEEVS